MLLSIPLDALEIRNKLLSVDRRRDYISFLTDCVQLSELAHTASYFGVTLVAQF